MEIGLQIITTLKVINMMVTINMIKRMVLVSIFGKMELNMKAIF